jgi:hypothetical protein
MTQGNLGSPTLNAIRTIAEKSVLAHFTANADALPGVELRAGQTGEIRSLPVVILHAESARAHPDFGSYNLGNFELTFKIYVYSSADDGLNGDPVTPQQALDLHRARVEAVQGLMLDVEGLQSAWTEGTLYAAWIESDDEGLAGRRYGNLLTYTVVSVYPPAA